MLVSRWLPSAVAARGKIYVFGSTRRREGYFAEAFHFHTDGGSWECVDPEFGLWSQASRQHQQPIVEQQQPHNNADFVLQWPFGHLDGIDCNAIRWLKDWRKMMCLVLLSSKHGGESLPAVSFIVIACFDLLRWSKFCFLGGAIARLEPASSCDGSFTTLF
ncbi:hypothetical protein V6N12_033450 [Hibiscus sabdariffa]|uniref:Uncharacterized protein n=1 Tax=Hibiscus sabdariffa TaxID=183260 RepID=A0ABR2BVL6_9ROSI